MTSKSDVHQVDAVISAVNAALTIESAVLSTPADVRTWEDDGSTDDTSEIIEGSQGTGQSHWFGTNGKSRNRRGAEHGGWTRATQVHREIQRGGSGVPGPVWSVNSPTSRTTTICVAVGCNVHQIDADESGTGVVTRFRGDVSGVLRLLHRADLLHSFLEARSSAVIARRSQRHVFHAERCGPVLAPLECRSAGERRRHLGESAFAGKASRPVRSSTGASPR